MTATDPKQPVEDSVFAAPNNPGSTHMTRKVYVVCTLLIALSGCARADMAEQLVEITDVRKNLEVAVQSCKEFAKDLIGEEYDLNYEANELGLAPDDPAWLKLADIYQEFYDEACSYMDVDELTAIFADGYRERFSDSELAEIVAFHRTDAGSKYVSVASAIAVELNQIVNQRMAEGAVSAQSNFEAKIQEFWLEQDFKPKPESDSASL